MNFISVICLLFLYLWIKPPETFNVIKQMELYHILKRIFVFVLFTLKGFIHRYKNYKQITLIKFIFLFLLKKSKNLFHVFWCVLLYYHISQLFISKI